MSKKTTMTAKDKALRRALKSVLAPSTGTLPLPPTVNKVISGVTNTGYGCFFNIVLLDKHRTIDYEVDAGGAIVSKSSLTKDIANLHVVCAEFDKIAPDICRIYARA